ncbi:MAG: phenylalanine--tRNA ligase subunit alpha [Phycisphaerales bacterium]|nr:MAG: phenylalanine--tRNA ligase subunit alpha [Phycisphaerales bacterium]
MLEEIDSLQQTALQELAGANSADAIDAWRLAYLGNSGKLKGMLARLRDVPKDQKPAVGARLNSAKAALEEALESRKAATDAAPKAAPEQIDMTEPALALAAMPARPHIITRVRAELVEVFARMGFEVAEGPELEDDDHNFVKLNIPPGHPAREPADNFYIDDPAKVERPRMIRSQTSTVQIRVMEDAVAKGGGKLQHPIRIIAPGRVYRPDTVDATHSFMFHQIEGLAIDRNLSMADLKTTLFQFVRAYFGDDAQIRFTPTFYPFTEPSAQFEILVRLTPDAEPRWIELGGCGMVHPNVLKSCGVDSEEWGGFAFGFGMERLAMGKYKIPDIRMLFENDLRFLSQV